MSTFKKDIRKVVGRAKDAQRKFHNKLKTGNWIEEARKTAEKQTREVKKLFKGDVRKVRAYLEKERKELNRLQKKIPIEIRRMRNNLKSRKGDIERMLKAVKTAAIKEAKFCKKGKTISRPKKKPVSSRRPTARR